MKNISMSPIGDFFCISGNGVMSVWGRNNEASTSFSNYIHYSKEESKDLISGIMKKVALGNIIQQEVTRDGRLIVTLEQRGRSLKVWYQDKIMEPKKQQEENKAEGKKVEKKEDKVDMMGFNPYADIIPLDVEDMAQIHN